MNSRPDTPSSGHVVDLVADFVLDRLEAGEASRVREHLRECTECAADFEWAAAFHAEASHLASDRIVAISEGDATTDREQTHLDGCDACRTELDAMRTLEAPAPVRAGHAPRRRAVRRWQNWSLGALATAAIVLLLVQPWRGGIDFDAVRGLSQMESLPVRVPRSVPDADAFENLRSQGLEAYADARPADAAAALEQAVEMKDTDEVRLYLGSARWLTGDDAAAEIDLRRVAERASETSLREAARWQLANLYLGRGAIRQALPLLREVADEGRRFAGAAEETLARLADLGIATD